MAVAPADVQGRGHLGGMGRLKSGSKVVVSYCQYPTEGGIASIYTDMPYHEQLQSPAGQGPLCVPSKQLSVIFSCHKPADSPDSTSQMTEA